jgi:hypothetical protein
MKTDVKWAAQISDVREVSLRGSADLAFWTDHLHDHRLIPTPRDGRAEVMVIAAALKFMGVRFREVSVSVLAHPDDAAEQPGAFLVHAWNSCRFFAFCERVCFATPYSHADVHVSPAAPASFQVAHDGDVLFAAQMSRTDPGDPGHTPSGATPDGWEGPVYLPRNRRTPQHPGKQFFVRIAGQTQTLPFLASADSITLKPAVHPALSALLDSHFTPTEWHLRPNARHAKSKTYRRTPT